MASPERSEGGPVGFFDGGNRRDNRFYEACRGEPIVGESKGVIPLGLGARLLPRARKGGSEPQHFEASVGRGKREAGSPSKETGSQGGRG